MSVFVCVTEVIDARDYPQAIGLIITKKSKNIKEKSLHNTCRQLGEIEYAKTFVSKIKRPFYKEEFENKNLHTS